MERIVKNISLLCILFLGSQVFAAEQLIVQPISALTNSTQTLNVNKETTVPTNVSPTVPQVISFTDCTKKYMVSPDKLFYMSLASINANKFTIEEIQSKTGYIIFNVGNRKYLTTIARVDSKSAIVKITPADNNYYFPLGVLNNFYKYLDLNVNTPLEELN